MRILAALSGGVDSAVAAARLVAEGEDVVGVHLRTGVEAEGEAAGGSRSCCGADDARDAREVAGVLGIPFYVVDVKDAFQYVLEDFKAAYGAGRTPNPCVLCNKSVKFGRLLEIAEGLGATSVATGHYARIEQTPGGRHVLMRAIDDTKDQSYVLHALDQRQLARARFPLGALHKTEVRAEAERLALSVAAKPDSQDLCFTPGGDYRKWLRENAPESLVPGVFVDEEGTELGTHEGAAGFTFGQRRRLPAMGVPHHVKDVDCDSGRVTIAPRERCQEQAVRAHGLNWVARTAPTSDTALDVTVQIRHAGGTVPGVLHTQGAHNALVTFADPVFAPAPGQSLVAYVGESVLCGGTIERTEPDA